MLSLSDGMLQLYWFFLSRQFLPLNLFSAERQLWVDKQLCSNTLRRMFDTPVILAYVPQACVGTLQQICLPVLRAHQHDDVLPDLPDGTDQLQQYTLQRPAAEWPSAEWAADAADAFEGGVQHCGLVITATCMHAREGVWPIHHHHSSSNSGTTTNR